MVGYSHHQYIKEEILIPLELHNTFASLHEVDIGKLMSGYYVGFESDIKANDYGLKGYGSMVATAQDVGIFLRALNDGSLFEEGEQEIYSSIYLYEHSGLVPGYQSIANTTRTSTQLLFNLIIQRIFLDMNGIYQESYIIVL